MIRLHRIDHVCLRVADLDEAAARWALQFGLIERSRESGRALLACNDEPYCLELVEAGEPGHDHAGFELGPNRSLDGAKAPRVDGRAVGGARAASSSRTPTGAASSSCRTVRRRPRSTLAPARPALDQRPPRRAAQARARQLPDRRHPGLHGFYRDVLGMQVSDWLEDGGVWFNVNSDHVMALVDRGYAHFHHLAFETVDIGKMRDMLDHVARHGRWLGWGPTRHGIAGNIASYVRIVEESCFVELLRHGAAPGRPRAPRVPGRLPRTPGAAAAAVVLPLRLGGDRVRAPEPRDPRPPASTAKVKV